MAQLPPDIEQRIARDERLKTIRLAIDVENELRESRVVQIILKVIDEDANEAMEAIVTHPPGDVPGLSQLQARIQHWRLAKRALHSILEAGRVAEDSIREEELNSLG